MTADPTHLRPLVRTLSDHIDEASKHLRTQPEWKDAAAYLHGLKPRIDEIDGDSEAAEDAVRELQAQIDLLAIGRERSQAEEKRMAAEKAERRSEDKAILADLVTSLKLYGWTVAASFLLTPVLGMTAGRLVVLAAFPAILGWSRMQQSRGPTDGRHWVILRGDVDVVLGRAAFYDRAALMAVCTPLVFLIFKNLLVP